MIRSILTSWVFTLGFSVACSTGNIAHTTPSSQTSKSSKTETSSLSNEELEAILEKKKTIEGFNSRGPSDVCAPLACPLVLPELKGTLAPECMQGLNQSESKILLELQKSPAFQNWIKLQGVEHCGGGSPGSLSALLEKLYAYRLNDLATQQLSSVFSALIAGKVLGVNGAQTTYETLCKQVVSNPALSKKLGGFCSAQVRSCNTNFGYQTLILPIVDRCVKGYLKEKDPKNRSLSDECVSAGGPTKGTYDTLAAECSDRGESGGDRLGAQTQAECLSSSIKIKFSPERSLLAEPAQAVVAAFGNQGIDSMPWGGCFTGKSKCESTLLFAASSAASGETQSNPKPWSALLQSVQESNKDPLLSKKLPAIQSILEGLESQCVLSKDTEAVKKARNDLILAGTQGALTVASFMAPPVGALRMAALVSDGTDIVLSGISAHQAITDSCVPKIKRGVKPTGNQAQCFLSERPSESLLEVDTLSCFFDITSSGLGLINLRSAKNNLDGLFESAARVKPAELRSKWIQELSSRPLKEIFKDLPWVRAEDFDAESAKRGAQQFLTIENPWLKEMNDTFFQNKDLVTALTKQGQLNFLKNFEAVLSTLPKNQATLLRDALVAAQSDFKLLRLSFKGLPEGLQKTFQEAIEETYRRCKNDATKQVAALRLEDSIKGQVRGHVADPHLWNLAGFGKTRLEADAAVRLSRLDLRPELMKKFGFQAEAAKATKIRNYEEFEKLLDTLVNEVSNDGDELAKALKQLPVVKKNAVYVTDGGGPALLKDGRLSPEVIAIFRSNKDRRANETEYLKLLKKAFYDQFGVDLKVGSTEFNPLLLKMRDYLQMSDIFSPSLMGDSVPFNIANKAVKEITHLDFRGVGAENVHALIKSIKPPFNINAIAKSQDGVTQSLNQKKEILYSVFGKAVSISGDEVLVSRAVTLKELETLNSKLKSVGLMGNGPFRTSIIKGAHLKPELRAEALSALDSIEHQFQKTCMEKGKLCRMLALEYTPKFSPTQGDLQLVIPAGTDPETAKYAKTWLKAALAEVSKKGGLQIHLLN